MGCCTSRQIADSSASVPSRSGLSPTHHTTDSTAAIIRPSHANDSTLTTPSTRLPNPPSSNSLTTSTGAAGTGGGNTTSTARPPRLVALSRSGTSASGTGPTRPRPTSISTIGTHPSTTNLSNPSALTSRSTLPLRPPAPFTTKSRLWTRSQLRRERTDFFETTVTGRPEVWAALRSVAEFVRQGDLGTAQAVIDAVGFTMPTGDLVDGGYDEAGALYRVPAVVLRDPENVVEDDDDDDDDAADAEMGAARGDAMPASPSNTARGSLQENKYPAPAPTTLDDSDTDSEDDVAGAKEAAALRKREEKGKGSERDSVRVKARLSDRGGPDVIVLLGRGESVGALARRVRGEACLSDDVRVRIAYLGKMLKETEPLLKQGWVEGHVVNALVALPS